MLETFVPLHIKTSGASIHVMKGGSGEPLLLLHGFPQTHVMWHKVAPRLAESFTVVLADLRGYGDSSKPTEEPDHATYSKRVMAQDMIEVMSQLGYDSFHAIGHDRGARVLHRMLRDHGPRIKKYDSLAIWRKYAETVQGYGLPSGHFVPEEAPEETYNALQLFFSQPLIEGTPGSLRKSLI